MIRTLCYFIWVVLYVLICLLSLPIHLFIYWISRRNSFSGMVDFIDDVTERFFDN